MAPKKARPPSTTKETMNSCRKCSSLRCNASELPANDPAMDPQHTAAASANGVCPPIPRARALVSTDGNTETSMVP